MGGEIAHDFSLFALFMQADWVVKAVMVGLFVASIWCWAIIANRALTYGRSHRQMRAFEKAFASGMDFTQLLDLAKTQQGGMASLFRAAMEEWDKSHAQQAANAPGLQSRLELALDLAVSEESRALEKQ